MLCAQNRGTELATHVRGALTNGATEEEIREVILQAAGYCGESDVESDISCVSENTG